MKSLSNSRIVTELRLAMLSDALALMVVLSAYLGQLVQG